MIREWIHKYRVRINMIGFREIEKPLKNIYIAFMEYKFRYRNLFWRNKQFGFVRIYVDNNSGIFLTIYDFTIE